jgi:hypothetical protein
MAQLGEKFDSMVLHQPDMIDKTNDPKRAFKVAKYLNYDFRRGHKRYDCESSRDEFSMIEGY